MWGLVSFLRPIFEKIIVVVKGVYFRTVAIALMLITVFRWVLNTVTYSLNTMLNQINELVSNGGGAVDSLMQGTGNSSAALASLEVAGVINTFVPLEEFMAWSFSVYSFWLAKIVFRWVKSFIPTVAN